MGNLNHGNLRVPPPPTPTSVGIRPSFPGLLTSTLPEFSDEFPAFPGFRGRYWYRVPLRCGVWWTSRRHDRDEPWLQPCFYAVSPASCMFFRELNVDMLSLENGGSFWQYCKLEAHEGPYCIHFEVLEFHYIHSDWTRWGGDLWCWSFPVKISSSWLTPCQSWKFEALQALSTGRKRVQTTVLREVRITFVQQDVESLSWKDPWRQRKNLRLLARWRDVTWVGGDCVWAVSNCTCCYPFSH